VLQGVRVLAVGGMASPSPYVNVTERGYSTVTLALTPEQVAITVETLALAQGGLVLALRNPKAECPCDPVADVGPAALRGMIPVKGN
jgi:Flp pilus assembly protein CpaB